MGCPVLSDVQADHYQFIGHILAQNDSSHIAIIHCYCSIGLLLLWERGGGGQMHYHILENNSAMSTNVERQTLPFNS